jgi:sensor histidine kinase YesM
MTQPGRTPAPVGPEITLDDRGARLIGIPFVALAITHFSGVLGPYGPRSGLYWLGCAWFVLLSGLLWHANRYFRERLRLLYDWLDHPWRKLALLLAANVLSSVPLAAGMLVAWYRVARLPIDGSRLVGTTLVIVLSVVFVTHVYEMVDLIRQRERDLLLRERLDRARLEAELFALKSQVDPHFLYNALSSLAWLIPRDPRRAVAFAERLGEVYHYILSNRERNLVPLGEELRFAAGYADLLRLRFGDAVRLQREGAADVAALLIPPVSLQVLLENAVKHNAVREEAPLEIRLALGEDWIEVSNRRRLGPAASLSAGVGLSNLDDRYRRTVGRGVEVREEDDTFTVILPLLRSAAGGPVSEAEPRVVAR